MCCDSKHGGYVYDSVVQKYGDTRADDELTRCRCTGYVKDGHSPGYDGCKCCHKATGEDFRCNRCRTICSDCSVVLPKVVAQQ